MTTDAESRPFNATSFYAFLKEGRFMGVRCRENGKRLCRSAANRSGEPQPQYGVARTQRAGDIEHFHVHLSGSGFTGGQRLREEQSVLHGDSDPGRRASNQRPYLGSGTPPTRRTYRSICRWCWRWMKSTQTTRGWCFAPRRGRRIKRTGPVDFRKYSSNRRA